MALSHFFAVFATCIALVATSAQANETQEINLQYRKGDLAGALTRANAQLAKNPKDAQVRFLKGLILADQGKTNDAIVVFTELTEDYPELPEPYNNLAVLYASQNKFDEARNALESAIRTHPSYATAHENLGDIYAKMASIAYDKALALDSKNATAQTKLALIQEMIGVQPRKSAASKPAAAAKPVAKPAATEPAKPATKPAAAEPAKPVAAEPVKPAVAVAEPSPAKPATAQTDIEAAVNRWAQAWSARDVDAYLAAYASDFTADGMLRADWEAQRRARISAPKVIEVKLSDLKIEQQGTTASATFRQSYRSDRLSSTTSKTLKLTLQNGQWRIIGETSR